MLLIQEYRCADVDTSIEYGDAPDRRLAYTVAWPSLPLSMRFSSRDDSQLLREKRVSIIE